MAKLVARDLVGTWRLLKWDAVRPDGAVSYPLGPRVAGLAIYGADGWMISTMMSAGRKPLSTGRARSAPVAERAAAFDGFLAYGCRWRLVDDMVEHEVLVALNPAMVGTRQRRRVSLSGRRLVLSTDEIVADGLRRHRLVLQRVPAARFAVQTGSRSLKGAAPRKGSGSRNGAGPPQASRPARGPRSPHESPPPKQFLPPKPSLPSKGERRR